MLLPVTEVWRRPSYEAEIHLSSSRSGFSPNPSIHLWLSHPVLRFLLLLFWVPAKDFPPRNARKCITILLSKIPNLIPPVFTQSLPPYLCFLSLPQENSKADPLEQRHIGSRRGIFFSTSEDYQCRLKHFHYTATRYYSEWAIPFPCKRSDQSFHFSFTAELLLCMPER